MFKVIGLIGTQYVGKEYNVYQVLVKVNVINFIIFFRGHWEFAEANNFVPNDIGDCEY